jgi:hypothetical protein
MIQNMFHPHGHFCYQKWPVYRITIPYMRWSQAWGLRALAELLACGERHRSIG